ncbi:Acetyltransferase (GNAT) domain-containing protein [Zobellia uliginosa]|uniref:Acetyltransferase (GNAT) domain-containing protein n=1 Tax=Zobellia uliginosa TaxID=143224 RepID=A0ABY1KNU1_9FLAO|nr:GNAT family N-acetyltransferase [Zobellia uliginosa]SIS47111.1 Acetyltransferase (GNAT) domain-containing protein [Zobellia uliginosa]
MEIKTLEGVDKKSILQAFNHAFSDYFISFKLTEEQLSAKMLADKIDLDLSVGVFDNGKLIALILHGYDSIDHKKIVYNGGTGVIPEKRGSGLTKQMYRFILPVLDEKGIDTLLLEVITKNIPAIASYKKSGFKIKRELSCYKGWVEISKMTEHIEIKPLQHYNWPLMESFWEVSPTWQNSKNVLTALKDTNISLGAFIENQFVGYLIFNPVSQRIHQIAVNKDHRKKGIASTLILRLNQKYGNTLSVINVDKGSKAINTFFNQIGLENHLEQVEMELELNKNHSDQG